MVVGTHVYPMPELPDVELARRRLRKWMRGTIITAAYSTDRYIVRPNSPAILRRALVGRTVREVSRRGKWLRFELDDGRRLFSHLGMTGDWIERKPNAPRQRSERARIDVIRKSGGSSSVRYIDSRRFGRLIVSSEDISEWRELGPDPLADGIDARSLARSLGRSRRAVKDALMDQSVLAGIGNILATEALWRARIDPRSRSDALSHGDVARIVRGLQGIIRQELEREAGGDGGIDVFSVYGRAGEPCPRCGSTLVHVVLGGRGTTFCKHCQVRRNVRTVATNRPRSLVK
jgi:formamidopyrimidine-DNA glycosylase